MLPGLYFAPDPAGRLPPRKVVRPTRPPRQTVYKSVAFMYFISKYETDLRLFLVGHKRKVFNSSLDEARRWGVPGGNGDDDDAKAAEEAGLAELLALNNLSSIDTVAFWSATREFAEEVIGHRADEDGFDDNVMVTASQIIDLCAGDVKQVQRVIKSDVQLRGGSRGDLITTVTSFVVRVPSAPTTSGIKTFEDTFFGSRAGGMSDTQKLGFNMNSLGNEENKETLGFVWAVLDPGNGYSFRDLRGAGSYEYLFEHSPQLLVEDEHPMIVFEEDEERRDDVVLLLRGQMNNRLQVVMSEIVERVRAKRQKKK